VRWSFSIRFGVQCCFLAMMFNSVGAEDLLVLFGTHTAGPGRGFAIAHFDTKTGSLPDPNYCSKLLNQRILFSRGESKDFIRATLLDL